MNLIKSFKNVSYFTLENIDIKNMKAIVQLSRQVCQHPNARMREWGAEAITSLIKAGLSFKHEPPASQNQVEINLDGRKSGLLQSLTWVIDWTTSLTNPLFSSEVAAVASKPSEGALQCPPRRYPTETAGVCPTDPTEPGRQSRTRMASGAGGHWSDPQ